MGIKIQDETALYTMYDALSKNEYSLLVFRIKNIHMLHYLYGKECDVALYTGIQSICLRILNDKSYICRLYSDHYVIFLNSQDPYSIIQLIYELDHEIENYQFGMIQHTIAISIGIYFLRRHVDFYQAYDHAKFAMQNSKDIHKYNTSFEFYDQKEIERAKQQFKMLSELEKALQHHEFEVYIQPKVHAVSHEIIGAEALIRWIHQGSLVPLKDFMPLIDRNAFIRRIDLFVFEEVCKLLNHWKQEQKKLIPISINISRASFEDGFYYLKEIETIFQKYRVDKYLIEFELSEDICFEDSHRLHRFLNLLKDNGFTCSLDDFGTGYSSFLTLTYLPIHTIKLDSSFCLGAWDEKKKIILVHLLQLLNELNFTIVAEGIETKEIADFFAQHSCHILQGFYFSKPLPIPLFERFLLENNPVKSYTQAF